MSAPLPWLEAVLDDRVQRIAERTSPWNKGTRTFRVDLVHRGRVGVQVGRPEHSQRIRRRISASRFVAAGAPQLRVPHILADGADAELPFVVTRWIEGKLASTLLATPSATMQAATRLHAVLGELSRLPPAPSDLSTVWADPEQLQRAALQWLAGVAERLDARAADVVADCVERTRTALDFASPVFAHGDVVPVNVLIDERGVVTLLDFEDARLAIGAFDRAMLWTTLAIHHPEAAAAFESLIAKPGAAPSSSVDRVGLATTGCLQRLERAYESLAGLGNETAAMGELARAAQLVAVVAGGRRTDVPSQRVARGEPASRGSRLTYRA